LCETISYIIGKVSKRGFRINNKPRKVLQEGILRIKARNTHQERGIVPGSMGTNITSDIEKEGS
ncbi:MAG: hypothetical protein WCS91_04365, partial [Bacilli bacterium]